MIDLGILIITYNSEKDILHCLQSIDMQPPKCSYGIVIVDNGSQDQTVKIVSQNFPNVKIMSNGANIGFAAANNVGLRSIEARTYLLLNPDTIILPGALQALIDFTEKTVNCWAVGPAILNADKTPQRTGVKFPNLWNLLVETFFLDKLFSQSKVLGRHRELYADYSCPRTVDYVQGSCFLIKNDAIKKVGLIDEQYFMFFEETDWCRRVWSAGGEVWFYPGASIIHLGGGEFGHYQETTIQYYHRSLLLFYEKYHSLLSGIAMRMIMIIRACIRLGIWIIGGMILRRKSVKAFSAARGYSAVLKMMIGVRKV
jgi:GT2 family glycosyltransferase